MNTNGHGGGCCGIRHLQGFAGQDIYVLREVQRTLRAEVEDNPTRIDRFFPAFSFTETQPKDDRPPIGKVIEVVLTDDQIKNLPKTCAYLKEFGFKLVHRFDNSTGSVCNVLHYCASTMDNATSPWAKVKDTLVEAETRTPQVGEVWRVNKSIRPDRHGFTKNSYVVIEGVTSWGFRCRYYNTAKQTVHPYVNLEEISFIRSEV